MALLPPLPGNPSQPNGAVPPSEKSSLLAQYVTRNRQLTDDLAAERTENAQLRDDMLSLHNTRAFLLADTIADNVRLRADINALRSRPFRDMVAACLAITTIVLLAVLYLAVDQVADRLGALRKLLQAPQPHTLRLTLPPLAPDPEKPFAPLLPPPEPLHAPRQEAP